MLKWAKPNQRRVSECSELNLETCSNLSSDSSESGITVPIRYHERKSSRPKSLALSSTDVLDLDQDHPLLSRAAYRTTSSPMINPICNRASSKRHSMIVSSRDAREARDTSKLCNNDSIANNNNNVLKISTTKDEPDTGVLKISTTDCDKPKSRNSFWKNLRAKAQGKKSNKKLEKANSMSNIPDLHQQSDSTALTEPKTPTNDVLSTTTCPSPIVLRRQQRSLADSVSPTRTKANVMRRRSFKLIKKQNENKKPKPFTKTSDFPATDSYPVTGSPDSGISSLRAASISSNYDSDLEDHDGPLSPITPINLPSDKEDMSCLRQQFTSAVLQYLNERLEKKGYNTVIDRSSSTSSAQSDDGAADIFCYDTDTVARRPSHALSNKQRVQVTH